MKDSLRGHASFSQKNGLLRSEEDGMKTARKRAKESFRKRKVFI